MPPKTSLSPNYVFLFVALCVLLLALPGFVHAQQPPTPEEINAVAKDLYCPLCNGVRLDTCELQACEQMREVIGEKLTEGVPKAQIMDEFVAQYGPVVLGEPLGWLQLGAMACSAGALSLALLRPRRPRP